MSHYRVAVFHRPEQKVEDLLAPYDENIEVEKYLKYTRQEAIDMARKNYDGYSEKSDDECWECVADGYEHDEKGNIYSTYNLKSKWDWWSFSEPYIPIYNKKGESVNGGVMKDLDFPLDKDEYKAALDFWDSYVVGNDKTLSWYKPEYYIDTYGTREKYAKIQAEFSTYAVITPDGEWHAPGKVGWFGWSSETPDEKIDWYDHYRERFIDAADPEWVLDIVDCHI